MEGRGTPTRARYRVETGRANDEGMAVLSDMVKGRREGTEGNKKHGGTAIMGTKLMFVAVAFYCRLPGSPL